MLNGKDILAFSEKEMRHVRGNDVTMIFQDPFANFNPSMMKRFPHEFSGGQSITIGWSLMLDSKVIVADESLSAFDVSIKAQVCNLLMDS